MQTNGETKESMNQEIGNLGVICMARNKMCINISTVARKISFVIQISIVMFKNANYFLTKIRISIYLFILLLWFFFFFGERPTKATSLALFGGPRSAPICLNAYV